MMTQSDYLHSTEHPSTRLVAQMTIEIVQNRRSHFHNGQGRYDICQTGRRCQEDQKNLNIVACTKNIVASAIDNVQWQNRVTHSRYVADMSQQKAAWDNARHARQYRRISSFDKDASPHCHDGMTLWHRLLCSTTSSLFQTRSWNKFLHCR
ncbi:hypothetical protein AC1031_007954 [Aphanomyces cochlioides]|nr:hypothetical protein AC1031_007954 [Aphanomyces cochlioides]